MITNAMMTANRYGALAAEIYDLDKPFGRLPDTAFHLQRFKHFDRPILEPACGSGRTLAPFLEAGLDVTGFDHSPEMLERCRARCEAGGFAAALDQQRMEDFRYPRKFGAILLPVGAFTLIDDVSVARSILRRFREALEPGGVLVLDIPSLTYLVQAQPDRRCWTASNGDLLTLEGVRVKTDWLSQRAENLLRYERWRDHKLIDCEMEPLLQRFWSVNELRLELGAQGFGDVSIVGGYDRARGPRGSDAVFTLEAVRR